MKGQFHAGRHDHASYGGRLEVVADVAVVGAGAGGCALATALSEAGFTVALFEEGRHWRPADFQPKMSYALRHLYQQRGARAMRGNVGLPLPGGRGVGGSTLINSAICFRCPDSILEDWHDRGCVTVDTERFSGLFDRVWDTLGVTVNSLEVQRLNNIVFKEGAEKLGLEPAFLARSAPGCVGCGSCQLGCPTGGKASVDRTFLVEALATGKVGVYANCRMRAADHEGDRITELRGQILHPETDAELGEVVVRAKTFVLSAGPIGSPVFLLSNRLAPNEHVGQHLVVHPGAPALAKFPFEIRPWHGVTQGCYVDCWDRGFLLQTYSVTPDQYFALMPTAIGAETMRYMADLAHIGSAGPLVHDEDSGGRVQVTPIGPDISYHLGEGDKKRLVDGLRLTGEVFFAAGAEEFMPGRLGTPIVRRKEDIAAALPYDLPAHHLITYASHPMGTCRMGNDDETSVVDPTGRVWGWRNLHVADASVFPTSLGVNPQVTTMAMALMIGQEIAQRLG